MSYFTKGKSTHHQFPQSDLSGLSFRLCALAYNRYFLFADTIRNSLKVVDLRGVNEAQQLQSKELAIDEEFCNLESLQILLCFQLSAFSSQRQEEGNKCGVLMVTNENIYLLELTMMQQEADLRIIEGLSYEHRGGWLGNIKASTQACEDHVAIMMGGYDEEHALIVLQYRMEFRAEHELRLMSRLEVEYSQEIKSRFEWSFDLIAEHERLVIYPTFVEKSMEIPIYEYDLHGLEHRAKIFNVAKLWSIHNHFHIHCVYKLNDALVVSYTKYTPGKFPQKCKGESYIWIYNCLQSYTKGLIDISGFVIATDLQQNVVRVISCADQFGITQVTVKNDIYCSPHFTTAMEGRPLIIGNSQYLVSGCDKQLEILKKYSKRSLYCQMCEGVEMGGEMMKEVMSLLD